MSTSASTGQLSFRQILYKKRKFYWKQLQEIERRAIEDWIHLLSVEKGSHTGYVHLRNVERNADKMIPGPVKEQFSGGEIFLLLSAILLHDIGKIVPAQSPVRCGRKEWNHHCASKMLIDEHWASLGLPDARIAGYCGLLAYSHCLPQPLNACRPCLCERGCPLSAPKKEEFCPTSLERYGSLRIPLLAAILRIADETESSWTRALRNEAYELYLKSGTDVGKAFRRQIEDVEFCHEGECIIMHVPSGVDPDRQIEAELLSSLADTGEHARKVIAQWKDGLKETGVSFREVYFEHGGRFFRDASSGFREPPPASQVFRGDCKCLTEITGAILRLSHGTLGYSSFDWASIENAIKKPIAPRIRWLFTRLPLGAEVEGSRISLTEECLDRLKRFLRSLSQNDVGSAGQAVSQLEERLSDALVSLWRGTLQYPYLRWPAIEARIGSPLGAADRSALKRAAEARGVHIERGRTVDEIRVSLRPGFRAPLPYRRGSREEQKVPKEEGKSLVETVLSLYNRTLGYETFTWSSIEAALRCRLTAQDKETILSAEGRTDLTIKEIAGQDRIVIRIEVGAGREPGADNGGRP